MIWALSSLGSLHDRHPKQEFFLGKQIVLSEIHNLQDEYFSLKLQPKSKGQPQGRPVRGVSVSPK